MHGCVHIHVVTYMCTCAHKYAPACVKCVEEGDDLVVLSPASSSFETVLLTGLELSKDRATCSVLRSQALEFSPHLAIFSNF